MLLCCHVLLYQHFLWVLYKMDAWNQSRDLVLCGVFQQKYLLFSSMDDQFTALHENPDMWVFCLVTRLMILNHFTVHYNHDIMRDSPQNHRYPWSSNARNPRDEPEVAKCGVCGVWRGRQVSRGIRHLKVSLFNSNIGLICVCVTATVLIPPLQIVWNGFRRAASGNHPEASRDQTDSAVLRHAAQTAGGVCQSRWDWRPSALMLDVSVIKSF